MIAVTAGREESLAANAGELQLLHVFGAQVALGFLMTQQVEALGEGHRASGSFANVTTLSARRLLSHLQHFDGELWSF